MILFVGYYGFGNLGDEAILSTILAQFRARRPELRLVAASGDPANTTASHGVEAVAWNDMAAIHRAVQIADLVVIGGGGLFHDYWGVDPDTFLTDKHWGIAYYAGPALLATLYRKPLMLYAVGVGPLCSGHGVKLTRVAAQAAQVITVRDPGSKRVLQETGIPGDKIRVTADPAFAFQPALPSSLQHAVGPDFLLRRPILGAAPRHWSIGVHPDFLEREMASALDLFLEQTGGSVVLLPFQNLSGERENDRATATRIHEHMRLPEKAALAHGPITPDQAQCWLRDCDLVLGMRLHALIFAATAAVPAVALSYDPKIDDIVQQLGLEKFSVNVKDIAAPQLAERLIQALHRGEEDRTAMSLATAELRKAADENVSMAFDLLDAPPREASSIRTVSMSWRAASSPARSLPGNPGKWRRRRRAIPPASPKIATGCCPSKRWPLSNWPRPRNAASESRRKTAPSPKSSRKRPSRPGKPGRRRNAMPPASSKTVTGCSPKRNSLANRWPRRTNACWRPRTRNGHSRKSSNSSGKPSRRRHAKPPASSKIATGCSPKKTCSASSWRKPRSSVRRWSRRTWP